MNRIAAKLALAAIKDIRVVVPVEGEDPIVIWFRVHRITSADMLTAGGGFLLAVGRDEQASRPELSEGAEESEAARIERIGATLMDDPQKLAASVRYREAIVCAGVQQSSEDGKSWEPLAIVAKGASEPGANRLYVGDLPDEVVTVLSNAIFALSKGGAARDGINSFPGGGAAVAPAPVA